MKAKQTLEHRMFSLKDQELFARISGDFNPIHTDPQIARRLLFGEAVVHGVHSILWALDCIVDKFPNFRIKKLEALFLKPIFLNQPIHLSWKEKRHGEVRAVISTNGENLSIFRFSFNYRQDYGESIEIPDVEASSTFCRVLKRSAISDCSGQIPLFLSINTSKILFSNVLESINPIKIAILMATSRLVGMHCPGFNSLFTRLSISFSQTQKETSFSYNVEKYNKRFGLLKIRLKSRDFKGEVEAFLRPSLPKSINMDLIGDLVRPNEFKNKYALILGGSRGLGEITAKAIAAGGGKTLLTYNQGIDDIKRVVNEIKVKGHKSNYCKFNVLEQDYKLPDENITDIYYFASPRIRPGKIESFDEDLFEYYYSYFCEGARTLFIRAREKYSGPLLFLYPSTIFVNEKPKEFAEYIKAKEEGEVMSKELHENLSSVQIACPRLPRLNTDQNQSLTPIESENPVPIILSLLRDPFNFVPSAF